MGRLRVDPLKSVKIELKSVQPIADQEIIITGRLVEPEDLRCDVQIVLKREDLPLILRNLLEPYLKDVKKPLSLIPSLVISFLIGKYFEEL